MFLVHHMSDGRCLSGSLLVLIYIIYNFFIAQKVSNIHLVTKDYKIVPLTNLLGLLLAWRVVGGVCLVRLILVQQ
jgi:hypothetical protein